MNQWAQIGSHVIPIHDVYEHSESMDCWCKPTTDNLGVVIHNSKDGRELFEADHVEVPLAHEC